MFSIRRLGLMRIGNVLVAFSAHCYMCRYCSYRAAQLKWLACHVGITAAAQSGV